MSTLSIFAVTEYDENDAVLWVAHILAESIMQALIKYGEKKGEVTLYTDHIHIKWLCFEPNEVLK